MIRRLTVSATFDRNCDEDDIVCPGCGCIVSVFLYRGEDKGTGGVVCPRCRLGIDLQFEPAPDETED